MGHEAGAAREAVGRAPADVLLARAGADPGAAAGGDARRARHGGAGDVPAGRLHRLLPHAPRAVWRRSPSRHRRRTRTRSTTAGSATSSRSATRAGIGTTTSRRVAQIRREQIERLGLAGIPTLEALGRRRAGHAGRADGAADVREVAPSGGAAARTTDVPACTATSCSSRSSSGAWGCCPRPRRATSSTTSRAIRSGSPPGGWSTCTGWSTATAAFTAIWAHDRDEERRALERLLDLFHERLAADPDMHVYHYASYETAALKRLVAEHGTREEALDELLRREVFVDLYTVVRQSLRISHPRYSIKNVRQFFMTAEADLSGGDDAIVLYEQLAGGARPGAAGVDRALQRGGLRLDRAAARLAARAKGGGGAAVRRRDSVAGAARAARSQRGDGRGAPKSARRCAIGCSPPATPTLVLLGHLLDYHRREAKPVWWWFFARCELTSEELDRRLRVDRLPAARRHAAEPVGGKSKSEIHGVHVSRCSSTSSTPATRCTTRSPSRRRARSRRSTASQERCGCARSPMQLERREPEALIPGGAYDTREQQAALVRLGALDARRRRSLPAPGAATAPRAAARRRARAARHARGRCASWSNEVEGSYLFVQGPPGAGKTWTGARLVTRLLVARQASRDRLDEPQGDPQAARTRSRPPPRGRSPVPRAEEGEPAATPSRCTRGR